MQMGKKDICNPLETKCNQVLKKMLCSVPIDFTVSLPLPVERDAVMPLLSVIACNRCTHHDDNNNN